MSDKIYALNDEFFLDVQNTLYYDIEGKLVYNENNYNIIEIYIGLCNIILNNVRYINNKNIDEFFNNTNDISIYSNFDLIVSFNGYLSKYIELKDQNKTYNLYNKFFEQLKPKDFIELRFDENNICYDVFEVINNL